MKYNSRSRRMFLQGAGKTIMAIPFLQSLLPREAWSQPATVAKRYITMMAAHEVGHHAGWLPNLSGSVSNLLQPNRVIPAANGDPAVRWQPLQEFVPSSTTSLAPLYGTTLNNHLSYLNIIRGLDFPARWGHGMGATLGALSEAEGYFGNPVRVPTMDAVLANNRRINPSGRYVFAGTPGGFEGSSRNMTGGPSTCFTNFQQLYNALFDNGNFPETDGNVTPPTPAHPRRDLLNRVLADYTRVINSRNISAQDRIALSNAMDKMSDVHRGLSSGTPGKSGGSCSYKSLTRSTAEIGTCLTYANESRMLVDMLTAAILCDSMRIITLGLNMPYTYMGINGAGVLNYTAGDWHADISHLPFAVTNNQVNWRWTVAHQSYLISRLFAPLVQNLAAATDPSNGRSYLYNSIVQAGYESGIQHGWASHPAIIAGNAGGAISSGNYIDYSDRTKGAPHDQGVDGADGTNQFSSNPNNAAFAGNYVGLQYNRFLVTMMQAMGLTPAEYENNSVNSQVYNRTDIGAANTNLTAIGGFNLAYAGYTRSDSYSQGWFRSSVSKYDLRRFRERLTLPPG